jgi:mannose-1-phosphate guanylyltransferase
MQIIISCGGGGTRLWPLSTKATPKQFVPILDNESLLTKTYKRLVRKFSPQDIWVITNVAYKGLIRDLLPKDVPDTHILTEPEKRDTFPAIVSAAAVVAHHTSQDEPLIFVPCDDWMKEDDENEFNEALEKISQSLASGEFDFITVGIKPTFPNPQYGHIEIDPSQREASEVKVVPVRSFKEKPDLETATKFNAAGNYFWHKHNPSFTYRSLITELQRLMPEYLELVTDTYVSGSIDPANFVKLPKIAIDYAILEKVERIGAIVMRINWDDVGSWETVEKYLPTLESLDHNPKQIELAGSGNKVRLHNPERKVAFVGVSNLLLVESADGILIIDPKYSAETKKVSEYFEK